MRSRRWAPLAVAAAILAASLLPASLLPGGGSGGAVGPIGIDKLLHAGGYAVLALTALCALRARSARASLGVILLVTVFGGAVELLQAPVAGRHVSTLDLAADAVGAAGGAVGWWLLAPKLGE